jgi:hypothetical protein
VPLAASPLPLGFAAALSFSRSAWLAIFNQLYILLSNQIIAPYLLSGQPAVSNESLNAMEGDAQPVCHFL